MRPGSLVAFQRRPTLASACLHETDIQLAGTLPKQFLSLEQEQLRKCVSLLDAGVQCWLAPLFIVLFFPNAVLYNCVAMVMFLLRKHALRNDSNNIKKDGNADPRQPRGYMIC